jgi:hypothetical protein
MKSNTKKVRFILPLIALCLPLFVEYGVSADNSCPYEKYIFLEGKCVDLSEDRLNEVNKQANKSIKKVDREIKQLNRELNKLCSLTATTEPSSEKLIAEMCQNLLTP